MFTGPIFAPLLYEGGMLFTCCASGVEQTSIDRPNIADKLKSNKYGRLILGLLGVPVLVRMFVLPFRMFQQAKTKAKQTPQKIESVEELRS